jgi:hypothetical protein
MNWQNATPASPTMRIVDAKAGEVACVPPRKKVAIVGFSSSSRHLAPWTDPEFEIWGMNQAYEHFERRPDRWFEIHMADAQPDPGTPTYHSDLATMCCPIYMLDVEPQIPMSVKFPLTRVLSIADRGYFTSTAAYMVALAISEGFEEIAAYGIDCTVGTEYEVQKPCLEWWLGIAMGRGIKVTIPTTSALLKAAFMYGYEPTRKWPRVLKASEQFLDDRIAGHKQEHDRTREYLHKLQGAIEELTELKRFAEAAGRGSEFKTVGGDHEN